MLFNVTENCGNMDSNLLNKVSQIIEIEDDVIDLDGAEKTPEEVIYEWDAKIRKKLSTFAVADNEYVLGDLMKEYLQSLQEMTRSYEDNETLKNKVFCHISFLYSYYVELQCCTPDNYLSNMEDILTLHCNLELEVIRPLKKKDLSKHKYKKRIVSVSRQIIHVLTVYLLERHDHILHVLIKMNTNKVSDSCSEVLNILYTHFLTKVPAFNLCDESFCRNYIVFQKWKEIRKVEDWEGMDKIMYRMFKRTPESIKNNETLRQILMPACQSTVDIVLNLFRSFRAISSAYFKHVVAKRSIDMDDLIFNIDLGEDEPTIAIDDDNDEGVQFLKAYYEVERNMSNLSHTNTSDNTEIDIFRKCKEEFDEDDDVQFIGITMLPKQPILDFVIDNEEPVHRMSNVNTKRHIEEERIPVPSPPLITSAKEKNADLENLNGITRICIGSPRTVPEPSNSCQPTEIETDPDPPAPASRICIGSPRTVPEPSNSRKPTEIHTDPDPPAPASRICIGSPRTVPEPATELQSAPASSPAKEVVNPCDVPAETQPEVSFVSNNTQIPSPSSPTKISDCDNTHKRTIEMKSVEVQADSIKNYLYNDYGLTTPPSDVPTDEQNSRPVEPRLYTNIGQTHKDLTPEKEKTVATRTVEVQVDCEYDYGLTPPNDPHLEDHGARAQEPCLYTNIGHKDLSDGKNEENFGDSQRIGAQTESETEIAVAEHDSDYDEFDIPNVDGDYDTEEIDVESCHENDKDSPLGLNHEEAAFDIRINPDLQISKEPYDAFKTSDQIDTGQKVILNTAPNIEPVTADSQTKVILNEPVTADSETKETYNGGSVLKPLVSSNRTNGHAKDVVNTPTKIMYTSSQKIKAATLDDFSRFESAMHVQWNKMKENHDFEEILSGPVSKIMPTKLLSAQDKLDIFGQESKSVTNSSSRSNSPNEMTSPAYEAIDDFRNYFSDSVNGRVPPPHDARVPPPLDARVPPGILKKNNTARRKNFRIMFHESTCDNSEERKPRSDGVLVPKRVRRDRKLNMEPRVVVERLSFIENKMKKVLNNPPTLRVDYDKTTTHINEKDVVRCISPPRFSWIINLTPSRHNPGKVKSPVDVHTKKVTKCVQINSSCCNQLAEEFTKLNCNAEDKALNLTIPPAPIDPETEFSNSPTFLPNTDVLVQRCIEETTLEAAEVKKNSSLLCDNSNFYDNLSKRDLSQSNENPSSLLQLPTAVPESYDFEKNLKNEVFSKIDWQSLEDSDGETRLPLKKRKLSVANELEEKKEEISYPATPMISIAEVEALHPRANNSRPFKTPAERKEMPPLPVFYNVDSDPSPIITDQFNINNHTYNNPTINYHMNNVPVPFINIPCGSYYSLPPILVPFNNGTLNPQEAYVKKENRKQGRQRRRH